MTGIRMKAVVAAVLGVTLAGVADAESQVRIHLDLRWEGDRGPGEHHEYSQRYDERVYYDQRYDDRVYYDARLPREHRVRIPPGHYPPPGMCRVWYQGRPPGHQPPPVSCHALGGAPPGGIVVIGSDRHRGEARRGPPRGALEREWRDGWRDPKKAKKKGKKGKKKGKRGPGWHPGG